MNRYVGAYQNTGIKTASKERGLLMLYEGAIQFLHQAKDMMASGDMPGKAGKLARVSAIIETLDSSLDHKVGGEIAANLSRLYEYMSLQVTRANMTDDVAIIDEVISLLATLHEGWVAAANQAQAGTNRAASAETRMQTTMAG